MKNLIYISTAFAFLLVLSSFEMNTTSSAPNTQMNIENDTSIIQSYIFHVQKHVPYGANDETLIDFQLERVIESEGYLKSKSGFNNNHQYHEEEFLIIFFNQNKEEIYSVKVANPLIKHFEVSEEDGTLERKRVEVDEETITIRANKLDDYAYYEVYTLKDDIKEELIGNIDLCEALNTGYIVAINSTDGLEAEAMKIYIDGKYIGEIPPGGESVGVMKPAGKVYEVKGITASGARQIKDIDLAKCEEVGVRLLYKE